MSATAKFLLTGAIVGVAAAGLMRCVSCAGDAIRQQSYTSFVIDCTKRHSAAQCKADYQTLWGHR